MRALPTRRRVVPTALMALGFSLALAGSFGVTPMSSADEGQHESGPVPTTVHESGGVTTTVQETTTTTCPPEETTTTTAPETTTTTVAKTTTTVPKTTTTEPERTTTTVQETTTTVAQTTTTAEVKVFPTTTIKYSTPSTLAVTGNDSSLPMMGLGVSLFVLGLVLFEIRAARAINA